MSANIYRKTLRDLRGQLLVWSGGLAFLGAVNVLFIPTIQNMEGLTAFLENLPAVFKSIAGDVTTMATPTGFLRLKLLDPLPLLLAIFGVNHGAQALAGEQERKTLDLLLAQPVRRSRVALEKFLAIATALALLCLVTAVTLALTGAAIDLELRASALFLAALAAWPLSCLFAALALLGSCALPRARHAAITTGAFIVAAYTFESLAQLSPAVARWQAFSLFHLHKSGFTMGGELMAGPMLTLVGLAAAVLAIALVLFSRRDLTA